LDSKLDARSRELSDELESAKGTLSGDLQSLKQKVEVDVGTQIANVLSLVEDKVQTSIDTMSRQLDSMNSRVQKEMEPRLAEAGAAAQRANTSVEALKTRVQLDSEELKTGFSKGLSDLAESVGTMEEAVTEVQQMADINSMLMGAAAASPGR